MKPGRRRDEIWKHVKEQSNGRFTCNYCGDSFKGGGSRIKSHLYGEKGGGIRRCPNSPLIGKNNDPSHDSGTISNSIEIIPSVSDHNTTQSPSFVDANLKEDVDNLIVEFLSLNNLPLETVEQPCFRNLFGAVTRAGTKYELPTNSSTVFKDSLHFVKEVSQYIRKVCSSFKTYGCTIVVHLSPKVDDMFAFLKRYNLDGFSNFISIYSPEGAICTYPADTYCSVESSFLDLYHEIKRSVNESPAVFVLFDSSKISGYVDDYVDHGEKSVGEACCAIKQMLILLEDMHKKSDLFSEIVRQHYRFLSQSKPGSSVKGRHEKDGQICNYPLLSVLQTFLQCGAHLPSWVDGEVLNSVGPLIRMLFIFDNFVPNIGYFYEAILKAKSRLKVSFDRHPQKFKELWELFREFEDNVLTYINTVAAYLNPGYMFYHVNLMDNECRNWLLEHLDGNTNESEEEVGVYEKKDKSIFTEEAISMLHKYHPVQWWKEFGSPVPRLQRLAIIILSQRVNRLSHSNHRLKFDCQSDNMLGVNGVMMEEFGKLEQENDIFRPIDLNILDTPIVIRNKDNKDKGTSMYEYWLVTMIE